MNREHDNNPKQEFSDEFLNAFLDNQLTLEEKDRAYLRISQDEALNRRVCELRKIQDMVRLSYQNSPPPPARPVPAGRHGRLGLSLAAEYRARHRRRARLGAAQPGAASSVGSSIDPDRCRHAGASCCRQGRRCADARCRASAPDGRNRPDRGRGKQYSGRTLPTRAGVRRHHQGADPREQCRGGAQPRALDEIESLVRYYHDQHQNARVEVVMNGEGLNLVRVDTTRFAERIRRMQEEYDNLTFAACQNTIQRLKREHGITAKLLPGGDCHRLWGGANHASPATGLGLYPGLGLVGS